MKSILIIALIITSMSIGATLHDFCAVTPIDMIPDNYYAPRSPPITDVYSYLESFEWGDDQQYELNVFDCSNMAAWLERHLECQGHNTQIRIGTNHAWIMVEVTPGNWLAYECTECAWKLVDDPRYYVGEHAGYYCGNFRTFDNIYDIQEVFPGTTTGQYLFRIEWM